MTNRPFYIIMLGGLLFFLGLVFFVGLNEGDDQTEQAPVEEVTFDPAAQYAASCASCHGANLEGAYGPSLIGLSYSAEEIADIMVNGIGDMPANMFNGSEEDRLALANWILEHK